jgi:hypothetical protein
VSFCDDSNEFRRVHFKNPGESGKAAISHSGSSKS